jgi:iron only hydrogenase large subunit-like protein
VGVPNPHTQLPVLSSHCPGWVCFAEKSQPQSIPYVSTVKSAQQILGSVMKQQLLRPRPEEEGRSVYFVSIQPCFDKKLEASRLVWCCLVPGRFCGNGHVIFFLVPLQDFYHTEENSAEVDLVLSTTELWRLLEAAAQREHQSSGMEVEAVPEVGSDISDDLARLVGKKAKLSECSSPGSSGKEVVALEEGGEPVQRDGSVLAHLLSVLPDSPSGSDEVEALCRSISPDGTSFLTAAPRNSGSGGYAEYLFKYAAQELYGLDLWGCGELPYKEGRNPDMMELELNAVVQALNGSGNVEEGVQGSVEAGDGTRKLKFARAYGFRNIQSVMLKVRRGQCDLDFVEIMACPSGCNNGGGQIRKSSAPAEGGSEVDAQFRETPAQSRERVTHVEAAFHSALQPRRPEDNPFVQYVYAEERLSAPGSDAARGLLHTRYHAVPKLDVIAPLATKW